jgi:hypothetical protein
VHHCKNETSMSQPSHPELNESSGKATSEAPTALPPMPDDRRQPSRARLAFRVGVVGHRPNRLLPENEPALRKVLAELLARVKTEVEAAWDVELYAADHAQRIVFRAVSSLAEGADRLFAEEALNLGYTLCCVMPFVQPEFEKDFLPPRAIQTGALEGFRGLLARARKDPDFVSYELDGVRSDAAAAYGTAGKVVLNQADLLIVVWDGNRQDKRGGTEDAFLDAIDRGLPAVWIDAHDPSRWQLVDAEHPLPAMIDGQRAAPSSGATPDAVGLMVKKLLDIPASPHPGHEKPAGTGRPADVPRERLATYFAERRPPLRIAVLWDVFHKLVGDNCRPNLKSLFQNDDASVNREWSSDQTTPVARVTNRLRSFYIWPDTLAIRYADRYRSTFLLAFLLAAFAVGMALLPVGARFEPHQPAEIACVALELAAIFVILALILQGRRRRWHERWLDYRIVSELVRHLRLVAPLGGVRPLPPTPAHWTTYGQPSATWMAWYVRSLERDLGLPAAVVDKAHLRTCLDQLSDVLKAQSRYHGTAALRNERLEHRLHQGGILLLAATLLACGLHFSASLWEWRLSEGVLAGLTFCCGFFPALGASIAGIVNQGEFLRIRKRSEAMKERLEVLLKEVEGVTVRLDAEPEPLSRQYSPRVSSLASAAARLLVHEVLDWRVVFLDRPLTPPT